MYYISDKKFKNYILLAASLLFYSWGEPRFIFIVLASTILDFYIVRSLYRAQTKRAKAIFLTLSISTNLGLLIFFKYANFFMENMNTVFSLLGSEQLSWTRIALPIGISFYTFQTLTYSID
ncbi:MAG: MBOAT family protein, partial [Bacteroidota bacterium]